MYDPRFGSFNRTTNLATFRKTVDHKGRQESNTPKIDPDDWFHLMKIPKLGAGNVRLRLTPHKRSTWNVGSHSSVGLFPPSSAVFAYQQDVIPCLESALANSLSDSVATGLSHCASILAVK